MMKSLFQWLFLLPVRIYQKLISPALGQNCRYFPSCSHYFIDAVKKNGIFKGSLLGVSRIGRCNALYTGGVDTPPRSLPTKFLPAYIKKKYQHFRNRI